MITDELLQLAGELAATAGLAPPVSTERLAGGRNNRVFETRHRDSSRHIVKLYHHDPSDDRDRLGAEWSFLEHVWGIGVRNVPQPLAADQHRHAALYSRIEGETPVGADALLVDVAASFVEAINQEAVPDHIAPASEACFSLAQHIASIDRRIARLATIDPDGPRGADAVEIASQRVAPSWLRIRSMIVGQTQNENLEQPVGCQILSPSDFGFHNCLVGADGPHFIDFEYAGRDDPAKLVCDFFCQPAVPVPLEFYVVFRDRVIAAASGDETDVARCDLLLNAYRIKWLCIMMNEFQLDGSARRALAEGGDESARANRQIDLITAALPIIENIEQDPHGLP